MSRPLFQHQIDTIAALRASLKHGKSRPMLHLPTGAGKTVLAANLVLGALQKSRRLTFVVPALSLIDQTVRTFEAEGIPCSDIGVIQSRHPRTNVLAPIQVATIQTLHQKGRIQPTDIVVIDEAHRWYDLTGEWMDDADWTSVPFIGLSATPWTKGLGRFYDDLISVTSTAELIEKRFLSPFRVFAPATPDLSSVRTVAGDFHEGDLSKAMDQPKLVADIVETWLSRAQDRPTFVFAVDRAHALHLQAEFTQAGVHCGYIDAHTKSADREALFRQFTAGGIRVIASVGCLTTGVDLDVRCIVLARPTKSEMLYVQIIGRGLRTAKGKDDLLILDHSDTTARIGFVDHIRHDKLDDGQQRKSSTRKDEEREEALPKLCASPACDFLKPPRMPICPACGFKATRQTDIRCDDGELMELTKRTAVHAKADAAKRISFLGQLQAYAKCYGHKPGYAAQKFKAKYGEWPDRRVVAPDLTPTPQILNWIKSQNIRAAKSRQKNQGGRDVSAAI
ncbi:DEAD/DEAH box helicase [Methylobacterium sp. CM6247]